MEDFNNTQWRTDPNRVPVVPTQYAKPTSVSNSIVWGFVKIVLLIGAVAVGMVLWSVVSMTPQQRDQLDSYQSE